MRVAACEMMIWVGVGMGGIIEEVGGGGRGPALSVGTVGSIPMVVGVESRDGGREAYTGLFVAEGRGALEGGGAKRGGAATAVEEGVKVGAGGREGRLGEAAGGEVEQVSATDWGEDDKPMGEGGIPPGEVALGFRNGVVGPGDWKREEAVGGNKEDGGTLGSPLPPRKSPSSPSITLLAGFDAREIVGATENESARLKLPEASSGFEGGGFLAICSANIC